jgi:micrococcal nuclease
MANKLFREIITIRDYHIFTVKQPLVSIIITCVLILLIGCYTIAPPEPPTNSDTAPVVKPLITAPSSRGTTTQNEAGKSPSPIVITPPEILPESTPIQIKEDQLDSITTTPSHPNDQAQNVIQAQVVRVIDGDTIEVALKGYLYTVRYIGIDTPETVHPSVGEEPFGKEASSINTELVEGRVVRLEKDISETDRYGRLLRYVYVNDIFINAELVRLGYAQVSTYPPDVKYQDLFLQLQREARDNGRGLWGLEEPSESPVTTPAQSGTSNIQITLIFYDGVVPTRESDEYVEITNVGDESVDIMGWVLKNVSEGYPSFTFPSHILQPGQSIRVYTNEIHPEYGGFSFGRNSAIWSNNEPDIAALYNPHGEEVSRKSY